MPQNKTRKNYQMRHDHEWVYKELKVPAGKVVGYMCRCGARNYIDLLKHKA